MMLQASQNLSDNSMLLPGQTAGSYKSRNIDTFDGHRPIIREVILAIKIKIDNLRNKIIKS